MTMNCFSSLVSYAANNGVPARWYYINISRNLIVNYLKALIASDILGRENYYKVINQQDVTVKQALKEIESGNAAITLNKRQN